MTSLSRAQIPMTDSFIHCAHCGEPVVETPPMPPQGEPLPPGEYRAHIVDGHVGLHIQALRARFEATHSPIRKGIDVLVTTYDETLLIASGRGMPQSKLQLCEKCGAVLLDMLQEFGLAWPPLPARERERSAPGPGRRRRRSRS